MGAIGIVGKECADFYTFLIQGRAGFSKRTTNKHCYRGPGADSQMQETRLRERKQLREIKIERSEGFLKNIFAVTFNIMINYVESLH